MFKTIKDLPSGTLWIIATVIPVAIAPIASLSLPHLHKLLFGADPSGDFFLIGLHLGITIFPSIALVLIHAKSKLEAMRNAAALAILLCVLIPVMDLLLFAGNCVIWGRCL